MAIGRKIANSIRTAVDCFYLPPFRFVPLTTFRYAVVGGLNLLYGIVQYWFIYNVILSQQDLDLRWVYITAPVVAFGINFIITFFTGFWLMKNVAFSESALKGYRQLIRYGIVVAINIIVNYYGLKLLIASGVFPSIANALVQPICVIISYLLNRYFTFGN